MLFLEFQAPTAFITLAPRWQARYAETPNRQQVTNEDKSRRLGNGLARISDDYVRMRLRLQETFGLRRAGIYQVPAELCGQRQLRRTQGFVDQRRTSTDDSDDNARTTYIEHLSTVQARVAEQPRELQELTARIERLRERLKQGDPDMTPDEIQAAIERAEAKAPELQGLGSAAMPAMKIFTMLPRAEAYRPEIALGLEVSRERRKKTDQY